MEKIEEKIKQLKIVYPDLEEMPDDIYANNVRVSHNMYDFVLYFSKIDVPPILEEEVYTKDEIKAKVVARIRLTPKVAEGLASALKQNIEAFSEDKEKGEKK